MEWIEVIGIILLILGFVLAAVEMIVPGFGLPGVAAAVCLVAGVFCVTDSLMEGAFVTLLVLALLACMLAVILWMFSRGKLKSPLILREEQQKDKGYISSADLNYLLGKKGVAVTDLHPAGTGNFDDIRFDVVSEGTFINKGAQLEIIRVSGARLIVRELSEDRDNVRKGRHASSGS